MSGKLDQSLDDIVKTRRSVKPNTRGGRAGARRVAPRKPIVGGITKSTSAKVAKLSGKAVTATGISTTSKILVTGLPFDVNEAQIKEYFQQVVAPVKTVVLTYGANGASRGVATVTFAQAGSAASAASKLDGTKVDGRPMKIEVIVSAKQAPVPKALGERVSQAKAAATGKKLAAKPVSATRGTEKASRAGGSRRGGRPGQKGRNKPKKTADELDAEMTDYFVPKENAPPAVAAVTTGGDASMDDQIM